MLVKLMLENNLNIPRRIRKRFERFVQRLEKKYLVCTLTLEDFSTIYFSSCHYCDHNLDPNSHCSPDIIDSSREYNLRTVVATCPFCKNLKNSCKLSKEETEAVVNSIVSARNKNVKGNSSIHHSRRRK